MSDEDTKVVSLGIVHRKPHKSTAPAAWELKDAVNDIAFRYRLSGTETVGILSLLLHEIMNDMYLEMAKPEEDTHERD